MQSTQSTPNVQETLQEDPKCNLKLDVLTLMKKVPDNIVQLAEGNRCRGDGNCAAMHRASEMIGPGQPTELCVLTLA